MYNSSARCFHVTLHGFPFPATALPWTLNNCVRLTLMWRFYEKNNPIERERIDGFSFYSDEYIIIIIIIISSLLPLGAPSASRHSRTTLYICMLDEINITLVPICVQSDSPSILTTTYFFYLTIKLFKFWFLIYLLKDHIFNSWDYFYIT